MKIYDGNGRAIKSITIGDKTFTPEDVESIKQINGARIEFALKDGTGFEIFNDYYEYLIKCLYNKK